MYNNLFTKKDFTHKSCRKRKYSCFKHVHKMICDDLSDEWISVSFFFFVPKRNKFSRLKNVEMQNGDV